MDNQNTQKKNLLILYNYPSYDGVFSALNIYFYYYFFNDKYNLKFIPITEETLIEAYLYEGIFVRKAHFDKIIITDKGLVQKDFDFILKKLSKKTSKIIIFDHHLNCKDIYEFYSNKIENQASILSAKIKILYDYFNFKSSCYLTFDYYKDKLNRKNIGKEENVFFANDTISIANIFQSGDYRKLMDYIGDDDTGNYKIKDTQQFKRGLTSRFPLNSYYNLYELNSDNADALKNLEKYKDLLEIQVGPLIEKGIPIYNDFKEKAKNELFKGKIFLIQFDNGDRCFACFEVNKTYKNYILPLLGKLSRDMGFKPIGAFIYQNENKLWNCSLMPAEKGAYDVASIAYDYGGEGFNNISYFIINPIDMSKLLVRKFTINNQNILNKYDQ